MENTKTKTLTALKEDRLFDFIASHYWEMTKDELGTIAKELAYALENALPHVEKTQREAVLADLADELSDQLHDDDEE